MPVYAATFSARDAYQLQLHIVPRAGNQAGNYTYVDWGLYIVETRSYGSWSNAPATWSVTVAGQTWSGASPYDFRASGTQTLTLGGGTATAWHDANGYATISFSGAVGGGTTIGSASTGGSLALARIPKVPGAPLISGTIGSTVLGPQSPTTSSMVVRFSGTTDGGSAIDGWELQYAENAAFTVNPVSINSNGLSTVTGLKSGVVYYFRARGHNGVGWGPYSSTASAATKTAVYVSDGTTWRSAELYVSDGTAWRVPELLISSGTAWQQPASL